MPTSIASNVITKLEVLGGNKKDQTPDNTVNSPPKSILVEGSTIEVESTKECLMVGFSPTIIQLDTSGL